MLNFNWGVFWAVLAAILAAAATPFLLLLCFRAAVRTALAYAHFSQSKLGDAMALAFLGLVVGGLVGLTIYLLW